ncbi:MAG: hypothetical protein GY801_07885 [bacterium]|nr:hypothetical protein [bacterium]
MFQPLKNLVTAFRLYKEGWDIPEDSPFIEPLAKEVFPLLAARQCWKRHITDIKSLSYDKRENIIWGVGHKKQLYSLDSKGVVTKVLSVPHSFISLEIGHHSMRGSLLLGKTQWTICVMDHSGNILWQTRRYIGINEVHWGDINGDGNDEIVLGMNVWGGLSALTDSGKFLWKIKMNNVWSHAVIPSKQMDQMQIIAIDASGAMKIYNHERHLVRSIKQDSLYLFSLKVGITCNVCQIAAIGYHFSKKPYIFAFAPSGKLLWRSPVYSPELLPDERWMAYGDINGDGVGEWVFLQSPDTLAVVSTQGERIATFVAKNIQDFMIARDSSERDVLIVLQSGTIAAYQFGT